MDLRIDMKALRVLNSCYEGTKAEALSHSPLHRGSKGICRSLSRKFQWSMRISTPQTAPHANKVWSPLLFPVFP